MKAIIGQKIGMTQVFTEQGLFLAATLVSIKPNFLIERRTVERHGYSSAVLGYGEVNEKKLSKPYKGQFQKGLKPTKHLIEIRDFPEDIEIGSTFGAEIFSEESLVDVRGTAKGKGFQGVMKRHGFGGGRKTHGSKFHRGLGSTGQSATPSKVFKGKKMPGRMGGKSSTVHNLKVVSVDIEKNLLVLGGPVPGRRDGIVLVTSAKKDGSNIPDISLMQTDNVEKETKTEIAE